MGLRLQTARKGFHFFPQESAQNFSLAGAAQLGSRDAVTPATVAAVCLTWLVDSAHPSAHRVYRARLPKGAIVKRLILASAVLLGGCVTAQEREQAQEQRIMGLATLAVAQCKMMGFKQGTEEYNQCLTVKLLQPLYQQPQQVQIQTIAAPPAAGPQTFAPPVIQYIPTAPIPTAPSTTTNCRPDGSGGYRCTAQ